MHYKQVSNLPPALACIGYGVEAYGLAYLAQIPPLPYPISPLHNLSYVRVVVIACT